MARLWSSCRALPALKIRKEPKACSHTGGLDWALLIDTGDGDDALAACGKARRAETDRSTRHPRVLQPVWIQPGRADHREGHGPDLRERGRVAAVRTTRADTQLLPGQRDHDPALRRGTQP